MKPYSPYSRRLPRLLPRPGALLALSLAALLGGCAVYAPPAYSGYSPYYGYSSYYGYSAYSPPALAYPAPYGPYAPYYAAPGSAYIGPPVYFSFGYRSGGYHHHRH